MEAPEELLLFGAGVIVILLALPFLLSVGSSFSSSFSGQATSLQIANNFHLNTPILYKETTAQIINFGPAIRLKVNILSDGSVFKSNTITFPTGPTNITIAPISSSSQTEEIQLFGFTGQLLATYDVQVINSNLFSLTGIGAGTQLLINSKQINFTPTNGNLTFAIPTGAYNFTEYSPYYYYSSEQTISNSNYNLSLPGATTLSTHQITVEQMLPSGTAEPLSLAVLDINYNSSIAKSSSTGVASFEYSTESNSIYINTSCSLTSCAGKSSSDISNNYTSVSKLYSSIPSTIILYPKFMTNVNLQMTCKVTTASPQQIEYVVPITITNSQNTATGVYQQMINISESDYSSYINYSGNTANFELMYPNNTHIPVWIQSNDSGTLITFAKLNNIPAGSSATVDLVFFNKSTNELSNSGTSGIGEASELSNSYAQYDDGAVVFNNYWNFNGTTLPSQFSSSGNVLVSNGITIGQLSTSGQLSTGALSSTSPEIVNVYAEIGSSSASSYSATPNGYTNLESAWSEGTSSPFTTNEITANIYNGTHVHPIKSIPFINGKYYIFGIYTTESPNLEFWYINNSEVASISSVGSTDNFDIGTTNQTINIKWINGITYPPNGIMPSVSFGAILKGNQNLTTSSTISAPTSGVVDFISTSNQSLNTYRSVGPSGTTTLWLPTGTYTVEATSFTNLVNSTSFTSSTNDQTETITFYSQQPCS
jgi:hypothetical protein